jgi:hypothetical protein
LVDNACILEEHAAIGFSAEEHTSLKMQAEGSPEILVTVYHTIWCPFQKTADNTIIETSKSHIQNKVFCLTL